MPDEYLVYANAADVEEAIQAGDLPALEEAAVARLAQGVRPERFPCELEPLLEDWLVHDLAYSLNAYIREESRELGHEVIIVGDMEHGGICPCCEFLAIDPGEDGMCEICPVCFWENGGDGPNHMTLADAKKNFEKLGAINERSLEHVAPDRKRKYRRGYT